MGFKLPARFFKKYCEFLGEVLKIEINFKTVFVLLASCVLVSFSGCLETDTKKVLASQVEPAESVVHARKAHLVTNKQGHYLSTIQVNNPNAEKAQFSLSIDGRVFRGRESVLEAIRLMPDEYPGEPDYIKAWRLVSSMHYHADPFIAGPKTHDPLLALNSVGYGYCDDVSAVLAIIWHWMGYESRVWDLRGHVVPEVWVDGKWKMFDPDYGIYYFDRDGEISTVESLSQDPSLILEPTTPIWHTDFPGYAMLLASIYDGREENTNVVLETVVLDDFAIDFELPPNATLEFPVEFKKPVLSYYASVAPLIGAAALNLAPGTTGEMNFPFVVLDISGKGRVEIDGKEYVISSAALSRYLRGDLSKKERPADAVTRINIIEAGGPIKIILALNAITTDGTPGAMVKVYQPSYSPRVAVMQFNQNDGFFARVSEWFLNQPPVNHEDFSPTSKLLTEVGVGVPASPVRLRGQLANLAAKGER